MTSAYARTERDLRWLAVNFSVGNISAATLSARLECLAACHRQVIEAEKASNSEPHDFPGAVNAYNLAIASLHAAGVGQPEGEFSLSPCCGPDIPNSRIA